MDALATRLKKHGILLSLPWQCAKYDIVRIEVFDNVDIETQNFIYLWETKYDFSIKEISLFPIVMKWCLSGFAMAMPYMYIYLSQGFCSDWGKKCIHQIACISDKLKDNFSIVEMLFFSLCNIMGHFVITTATLQIMTLVCLIYVKNVCAQFGSFWPK